MRWPRLAFLLAVTGCTATGQCAQVGCVSQLTLTLPAGVATATACVAGVCTSDVVGGALLVPLGRRAEGETAAVTVTLAGTTTAYEGTVPLTRTRPNGPRCPPVCVTGEARLDVAGGRVVPGEGPATDQGSSSDDGSTAR